MKAFVVRCRTNVISFPPSTASLLLWFIRSVPYFISLIFVGLRLIILKTASMAFLFISVSCLQIPVLLCIHASNIRLGCLW